MAPPGSWQLKDERPDWRITPTHVWRTRLRGVSLQAQAVYFMLTTGPNTSPLPGLVAAYEAELAGQMGCTLVDFRAAFAELEARGIAEADWQAGLVWVPGVAKDDPPNGPNTVKGWRTASLSLPACPLLEKALAAIQATVGAILATPEHFQKAFEAAFPGVGGGWGERVSLPVPVPVPVPGKEAYAGKPAPPSPPPPSEILDSPSAAVITLSDHRVDDEVAALREAWHAECPSLPRWETTPDHRRRLIRNALKRRPLEGPGGWREVFQRIEPSAFCRGSSGWKATVDWALRAGGAKPESAANVLAGVYDNPKPKARDITQGRHRAEDSTGPRDYEVGPNGKVIFR